MVYVALLRGINVGGKNKVAMPKLKAVFESIGCKNVLTYINSGNVIFADTRPAGQLGELIEEAIAKGFNLPVRVLIRDQDNIHKLCSEIPASWTNDTVQKTDVLFLWEEIDGPNIMDKVVVNPTIEHVRYIDGALVWNIGREYVVRGGALKLIKTNLYSYMTVRNINTVRKLDSLMAQIEHGHSNKV